MKFSLEFQKVGYKFQWLFFKFRCEIAQKCNIYKIYVVTARTSFSIFIIIPYVFYRYEFLECITRRMRNREVEGVKLR